MSAPIAIWRRGMTDTLDPGDNASNAGCASKHGSDQQPVGHKITLVEKVGSSCSEERTARRAISNRREEVHNMVSMQLARFAPR
jgi:hypothetical protein